MKKISLNNGVTFKSFNALDIDDIDTILAGWDNIVSYMDDETREQAHSDVAPCDILDFLKRYLDIAKTDLIIG